MFQFKLLFLVTAWMLIAISVRTQHNNAWFRATLSYPLTTKLKADGELQHRRQSGWGNNNPVNRHLMFTLRNWIHYQHSPDLKFSVSPFGYFYHYRVIEHEADEMLSPVREYRISAAIDWQHLLGSRRLYMVTRSAGEYRMFMGNPVHITRLRSRLGFRHEINKQVRIGLYDELFMNVSGVTRNHFYDHNRIATNLEYDFSKSCKLETGYIFVDRLLPYNEYAIRESNVYVNLSCRLKKR